MDILTLIMLTLAVYRVATDLAREDGPADAFARLRGAVFARLGADHWLSAGVACPICLSFWLAPALLLLWRLLPALVVWLAIAGGAALLARLTTRE